MKTNQRRTIEILVPEGEASGIIRTGAEIRTLVETAEILGPVFIGSILGLRLNEISDDQHVLLNKETAHALGLLIKQETQAFAIAA